MYIDGGVRQHHEPARRRGYIAIVFNGEPIVESVGVVTSNQAEYRALIRGLELASARGLRRLEVLSDSELLVKQVEGLYRVKSENIRPLFERVRVLRHRFERCEVRKINREENLAGRLLERGTA
jgi:ribonuclease HI